MSMEVVSLPMYPELDDDEVEHVIKAVKDFFAESSKQIRGASM
jgi:dTDP-4-amino-4,6-dideoxygalactose transaminase